MAQINSALYPSGGGMTLGDDRPHPPRPISNKERLTMPAMACSPLRSMRPPAHSRLAGSRGSFCGTGGCAIRSPFVVAGNTPTAIPSRRLIRQQLRGLLPRSIRMKILPLPTYPLPLWERGLFIPRSTASKLENVPTGHMAGSSKKNYEYPAPLPPVLRS